MHCQMFKAKLAESRKVAITVDDSLGDEVQVIVLASKCINKQKRPVPGQSYLAASGKVLDEADLHALIESSADMWLTAGRFTEQFEGEFARFLGTKYCSLTNSGSSANLLALSALTSYKLGRRQLRKGDEVITVAAGFPTTITPIVQHGLVPVFVDVEIGTYNADVSQLEKAISDKTRAVFLAHTLGNPFDVAGICQICTDHDFWLIEDNCDSLGSRFDSRLTGTFGHLATHSFYPAHHITMGEGGAVVTDDQQLLRIVNSFRDWGRDCWCAPGKDNSCQHRFDLQLGALPHGYDHKYTYSHLGYNLKATDMQAAVGLSQLRKLGAFIGKRRDNWLALREQLQRFENYLILPEPTKRSEPSWFGFAISVKPDCGLTRVQLTRFLESRKIGTRPLFAGNILRQPVFTEQQIPYRVVGQLTNTDFVAENTFWVGVWPGLNESCIDYIIAAFGDFFKSCPHQKSVF